MQQQVVAKQAGCHCNTATRVQALGNDILQMIPAADMFGFYFNVTFGRRR